MLLNVKQETDNEEHQISKLYQSF